MGLGADPGSRAWGALDPATLLAADIGSYLVAFHQLVNGPMQVPAVAPMLDAKYAAFQEHGVSAGSPAAIKTWITSARSYILSQLAREAAAFSVTSVAGSDSLAIAGTGPLDLAWLEVNGAIVPLTWDTTSAWRATVALTQPVDRLVVIALDARGEPLAGAPLEIPLGAEARLVVRSEGAGLVFEYPVVRSGRYQLQRTPSLLPSDWQTMTNPPATLGTLRLQVAAPTNTPAFYRVIEP
jgi:hypothetical protein